MSVKSRELENPERGLELQNRDAGDERGRRREDSAGAELRALRERVAAVKSTKPLDPVPHCGDCYRRGWAAAVRAIEEG
jgi:hypothetical protein